jgi:electron transport complex protein RnfD
MIKESAYLQTLPPHIRSRDSLAGRHWLKSAALFPVLAAALMIGKTDFARILFLSVMSVTGLEWLTGGFLKRKTTLLNGEALLTGLLFALLLPERCPAALIAFGAFVAVIIVNACFGGLGGRLFHTAVFGSVFLSLGFPGVMGEPVVFRYAGDPWMLGAIVMSAVLFLVQRQIYFETPLYFVSVLLAGFTLFSPRVAPMAALGISVFSASFLLTDNATLPLTRRGTNFFVMGAAFLAALLLSNRTAAAAVGYAVLIMNCLTPWLDVWCNPRRAEAAV